MEIGSLVAGKYRIDRLIGEGGMGIVVAATHIELGTPLALKFLNDQIKGSANSHERFTREARACAQLRSEHVCKVTDFGTAEGMPCLAMELLEGSDLSKVRASGPLAIATAADYILQACAGLAEAHAVGIVHRDLKPHNLFLTRRADGSPLIKVLDFGIAKIPVGDELAITRTSSVLGSPGYMAPEQLRSTKSVDARADIWALGVILYELTAGRHPFQAESVTEVAVKIAMDEPPPISEAPELQPIVSRCLQKEPAHRFPDVGALAAALAPLCARGQDSANSIQAVLGTTGERRSASTIATRSRTSPSSPLATDATVAAHGNAATDATVAAPGNAATDATVEASVGTAATVAISEPTVAPPAPPRRGKRLLVGAIGVAVVGAAAALLLLARDRPSEQPPEPPPNPAPVANATPQPPKPPPAPVVADVAPRTVMLEIVVKGAHDPNVSVDGVAWGEGRKMAREVTIGHHTVEVRVAGRDPITQPCEVEGPQTLTIEVPPIKRVASAPKPAKPDPAAAEAARRAELRTRLLEAIRTSTVPQITAGTCQQLMSVDASVVPWEKCVAAQCSVSPSLVMMIIARAPFTSQQGLRDLCPAANPTRKP